MDAVGRKARDEWVALFAEDGFVQDPVGRSRRSTRPARATTATRPSARFWDATIAGLAKVEFDIHDSFAAGDECANVATILAHLPGGMRDAHRRRVRLPRQPRRPPPLAPGLLGVGPGHGHHRPRTLTELLRARPTSVARTRARKPAQPPNHGGTAPSMGTICTSGLPSWTACHSDWSRQKRQRSA